MDTLGELTLTGFCVQASFRNHGGVNLEAQVLVDDIEIERFTLWGLTAGEWLSEAEVSLPAKLVDFRVVISSTLRGSRQMLGYIHLSGKDLLGRYLSFETVYTSYAELATSYLPDIRVQFHYSFSLCEFSTDDASSAIEIPSQVVESIQEIFVMVCEPIVFSNQADLEFVRRAISEMHPSKRHVQPGYLIRFARLFEEKYKGTREVRHLHNVMEVLADLVVVLTPIHGEMAINMDKLGEFIREWSERRQEHDGTGLERVIDVFEEAMKYIPMSYPNRLRQLYNLAAWYLHHIDRQSLDKSIAIFEITQHDPNLKLDSLIYLGDALNRRFRLFGNTEDLDRASQILSVHKPVTHRPHHGAGWWVWIQRWLRHANPGGTTSMVLLDELARIPVLSDFNKEIGLLAFELYSHPATWLDRGLFWDDEKGPKLNRPIHSFGDGITPEAYNTLTTLIDENNLLKDIAPQLHILVRSVLLHIRFLAYNDTSDLDNAIQLAIDADHISAPAFSLFDIEAYRKGPEARWLQAVRYLTRYRIKGDISDLTTALPIFKDCATSKMGVSIGLRLSAATWWGIIALRLKQDDSVTESYNHALTLLPQVPWLGLPLEERHKQLFYNESLAPLASSAAIELGDYDKALEWSEQGRTVIWNQLLQLKTSTSELEKVDPDLANRFSFVCAEIQADKIGSILNAGDQRHEFLARASAIYYPLVNERDELINRIRRLPGFETFLLPLTVSQLREAAQLGPIIILNASRYPDRCDALVLLPDLDEVMHIPLTGISHSRARELQRRFSSSITASGRSLQTEDTRYGGVLSKMKAKKQARIKPRDIDSEFAEILRELWYFVAYPILDGLALLNISNECKTTAEHLPRVWWCPIGPFSSLPIHAAGDYDQPGQCVFNYTISSYTPTVSALLSQRTQQSTRDVEKLRLLAVVQSSSDTSFPLPGTHNELRLIQSRAEKNKANVKLQVLYEDEAKPENALAQIRQANWVHFACHGVQDITNPTNSALLLTKGSRLRLNDLIKLSLPNAQLAFLSACQTATGVSSLPDEAIHLAAGMLLAGFRGIIATLWSIGDSDAPKIADAVYARLLECERGVPDSNGAALALHVAVGQLRQEYGNRSFMNWVPYVHIGL